ncbi:MAG: hypothetical protein U5L96_00160 [Owenweeksia sp.]|nr:hypothetical protein [Owenweeksia sp.]
MLIISNSDGEEIKRHSFRGNTSVSLRNKKAGIYEVKLIVDEDGNGEWSTGQYLSRTHPERIINYREEAEIRANWELELIWQP